ncbi:NAD-dependent epimerase/dehydratase [Desulforamulus reducens MI-1]|uniref:GDP-L-fucose synthase n=1 Tax=Desulforamulus reducens (strain ATCC BAA-1160 / DSM 100696 / MI-1) TaxID=349161 RepID=A4J4C2_DESRM|nr:GDP-L-fucose synthase [Desulforamulus reducens]ABO49925.1 NAD-dependent epimerase/dehydratase [Desulforamulus reducens MI-1]
MDKHSKIYIAGHRGLVGSAIKRRLEQLGYTNLVYRSSKELELRNQKAVEEFFCAEKPAYVFLVAAKVGGILANNTYPAEFIYDNLSIQTNVIHTSYLHSVKKLLFLGSSCIYPKLTPQPMKEEYLLSGKLEPTNEPYAIAKIAGIKMCQAYNRQYGTNFISVMPTNLYGPNDNFDLENSHVLPALIRKFHEAKTKIQPAVTVWGTGTPKREFLHVDDLADACVFLMEHYQDSEIINIGTGQDLTIKELAELVKAKVGYQGEIVYDNTKPDGTPKKLLDVSKLKSMGWQAQIPLKEGLVGTYEWYQKNVSRNLQQIQDVYQ